MNAKFTLYRLINTIKTRTLIYKICKNRSLHKYIFFRQNYEILYTEVICNIVLFIP